MDDDQDLNGPNEEEDGSGSPITLVDKDVSRKILDDSRRIPGIKTSHLEDVIAMDGDTKVPTTCICLNKEEYVNGFLEPFTLVLGDHFNRDTFHDSVLRFVKDGRFPDKTLKNRFISWYCEMFRQPQSVFYSNDGLMAGTRAIESTIERVRNAQTEFIPSAPVPTISLIQQQGTEKPASVAQSSPTSEQSDWKEKKRR